MYVYFIKESAMGSIKIGKSYDVRKRLKAIQACLPQTIEILGVIDGGIAKERQLQKQFIHLKIHGEWFMPGKELLDFINENAIKDMSLIKEIQQKPKTKRSANKINFCKRITLIV